MPNGPRFRLAGVEFLTGRLTENPHRVGVSLRKPFEGQWRARRGTYRIRHRVEEASHTVYVLDVEHRRDASR
jgi:mRNA interferase RelE/StbE